MTKKISFFVVTAAAVALVLSGCPRGPGMDDMADLDGTWIFTGFMAVIDGTEVVVTVGDGTMSIAPTIPTYAHLTQIVAKGTLKMDAMEGTAYKLTLSEEPDAITVMPEAAGAVVPTLKGLIKTAQAGEVRITVDEDADPDTITVTGSFLDTLAGLLGSPVEGGLVGCKDAQCMMAP